MSFLSSLFSWLILASEKGKGKVFDEKWIVVETVKKSLNILNYSEILKFDNKIYLFF